MTLADPDVETPLAVLLYDRGDSADTEMAAAAQTLTAAGLRLAGVVQANVARPERRRRDMRFTDLATGEVFVVSQDLGDESQACRLDLDAFAAVSHRVERSLEAGADLLMINRFGRQEAQGRGFVSAIARAVERGVPVIVAVAPPQLAACEAFLGGVAAQLPLDRHAIVAWRMSLAESSRAR